MATKTPPIFVPDSAHRVGSAFLDARKSVVAAQLTIYPTSAWTNETFETWFCGNLSALGPSTITGISVSPIGVGVPLFVLPSCFFEASLPQVLLFSLYGVIAVGTTSNPDPLVAMAKVVPGASSFIFQLGALLSNTTGLPPLVDWTSFFSSFSGSLLVLQMGNTALDPGTAIPSAPNTVQDLRLTACGIATSIPANMFSQYTSLPSTTYILDLSSNAITGSIPTSWFSGVPLDQLTSLTLSLHTNLLEGSISTSTFSGTFSSLTQLSIQFSYNKLSGDVSNLFASASFVNTTLTSVLLDLTNNSFTGTLPTWFSNAGASVTSIIYSLSNNRVSGTVPPGLFSKIGFSESLQTLSFSLDGNSIHGDLPSGLLRLSSPDAPEGTTVSPNTINLILQNNALNGTIASDFFEPLSWLKIYTASFNFGYNQLTGSLPSQILYAGSNNLFLNAAFLVNDNPSLGGSLPVNFLSSLAPMPDSHSTSSTGVVIISLANTAVGGALVLPDLSVNSSFVAYRLNVSNAQLTSLEFVGNAASSIQRLDLSHNKAMTGTLPDSLFAHTLSIMKAGNTLLSGTMPDMGSINPTTLVTLELPSTSIDFCSGPRNAWGVASSIANCVLNATSASKCVELYPSVCQISAVPCSEATKPLTGNFVCVGSTWTAYGTITTPTLSIPSGSAETIVVGNVTSSSIVLGGLGSTLVIQGGCATNLTSITIELSSSEISKLGSTFTQKILSAEGGSNCTDLSSVTIDTKISGSSCKKVKTKSVSDSASLSVVFSIDNSGCRTWWIILVAVVASVVVILVIVAVLLVIFVPSVRDFVRPYEKRNRAAKPL